MNRDLGKIVVIVLALFVSFLMVWTARNGPEPADIGPWLTYAAASTASAVPTATNTPKPTDTPTPTIKPIPTGRPTVTETPAPSHTSRPTLTVAPMGTAAVPSTAMPTVTPEPTEIACVYDSELVEVRDPYNYWYANSRATFDLILLNRGTCSWPEGTTLALVSDNSLGWPESWPVRGVGVSQTVEIAIQLTTPSTQQTFLLAWQLEGQDGESIGEVFTRTLSVRLNPTSTLAPPTAIPTDTPLPNP